MRSGLVIIGLALASAGCSPHADSGKSDTSDAWRQAFDVDAKKLLASGESRFYPLRTGSVWSYENDEGESLTITVLDQTETVDGVKTRVIEEREQKNGKLVEVSRNFFAMDPANGDMYYFGEDVDIYKNGKVVNHEGAWRSGVNGAKFGLFIAGAPKVGDRYYQEVAPEQAMDRAEVVSIDERVETPAGVFEHCLHIKETTPLEKGSSHKWFAPGVGLVRDDELPLKSYAAAPRER